MNKRPAVFAPAYYGWFFIAVVITYILHEGAHWLAGLAMGLDMKIGLNAIHVVGGALPWQHNAVSIAGPIVTIVQAIAAYMLVMRNASHRAFAMLYVAAFMRLIATAVSVFNPNDEARVSAYLGMGKWTLPLLVSVGLMALFVKASGRLGLTWKDQFFCYLVFSIAVSLIVGLDHVFF